MLCLCLHTNHSLELPGCVYAFMGRMHTFMLRMHTCTYMYVVQY